MRRQRLVAKYRGGWEGLHTPQRGKVILWAENGSLRFKVLSGCLPLQLIFNRKFDVPLNEIERIEAAPARIRGSDVLVYTRSNGILSFGFPYQQAPQARRLMEQLMKSNVDGNDSS